MFRVEKMEVNYFSFAVQLANTMNWNMMTEDFEFMTKLEPEGCFVLSHDEERAGIATNICFGEVGWFGNLIVKEDYRRKGAGTILVKHSIGYLKSKRVKTIGLYAYPHLTAFYEKFGFKPDVDFLVFQGKAASPLTGETAPLQKAKKQDIPAIIDFDSQCFGACRRKLLEPILRDKGNLCYIAVDDHGIAGFCAATVYAETAGIGPLMCRRNRVDAAVALLKTILGRLRNHDIFVCVQAEETRLLEALRKAGLQETFRVTRMFLGAAVAKNCIYLAESLERG